MSVSSVFADDLADVKQTGVIRLGVPPEYIPFVFFDGAGNNTGIDIALVEEIARRMGVKVQTINLAFDGMIDSLNLGQVDMICGAFSKTDERAKLIDFTRIYYSGDAQFIGLSSLNAPSTVTMESFRGLKIGVQKGTSFDQWVKTNLVSAGYVSTRDVYTYSTAADEMRALDRKDIDLALLDQDLYEDLYRASGKYRIFLDGFAKENYAFGLRKGSTMTSVVSDHLTEMIKDGTAQSIANRFFSMNFNEAKTDNSRSSQAIIPTAVQPVYVIPTAAPAAAACVNGMTFAADITITDGHNVRPGENFRKTWRVRNTGSCTWNTGYTFVFVSGDQMSGRNISVPAVVQPGQVIDLSVDLIAPYGNGTYRGYWQMRSPEGKNFGETIWVKVRVNGGSAPVQPTAVPHDGQRYTPINVDYFYPDYYAGSEGECVRVYWKADGASMVEVTVDGTSLYRGDVNPGSLKLCGPITSPGSHNVQLYGFNVTTDAYSSFIYNTEAQDGQRRVVPEIDYFYVDPDSGYMGDSATVYWSVRNAGGVTITVNNSTVYNGSDMTGSIPVSSTIQKVGSSTIRLTAHSVTDDVSATTTFTMYDNNNDNVYWNDDSGYDGGSGYDNFDNGGGWDDGGNIDDDWINVAF